MHLTIETVVGDSAISFDIDGDYDDVLALTTELGFCKKPPVVYNYVINNTADKELTKKIASAIKPHLNVGGMLSK